MTDQITGPENATVSAHVMQKREWPQLGTRATPSRGAMRQTSHVYSRHSGCVDGCSGSGSGWWVDDCWLVTGDIFVVAVSIRSMKSLGVRAQTVADCLQKLKSGVGAVVVAVVTLSACHSGRFSSWAAEFRLHDEDAPHLSTVAFCRCVKKV